MLRSICAAEVRPLSWRMDVVFAISLAELGTHVPTSAVIFLFPWRVLLLAIKLASYAYLAEGGASSTLMSVKYLCFKYYWVAAVVPVPFPCAVHLTLFCAIWKAMLTSGKQHYFILVTVFLARIPSAGNSFAPLIRFLASAVNGKWTLPKDIKSIPCPVKGDAFMKIPNTAPQDAQPFIDSLKSVPKSGMHNPLKNPERFAPTILHLQAATFSFQGQPSQWAYSGTFSGLVWIPAIRAGVRV